MAFDRSVTSGGLIATSHTKIPKAFGGRNASISSQAIRRAIEHLPYVDTRRLRWEKYAFLTIFFSINFALVYMSMYISEYFWVVIPIYFLRPLIDFIEILTILIAFPIRRATPSRRIIPKIAENFVYLLPCYNETKAELLTSLNSLVEQRQVHHHNKAIFIVCDGRIKGKDMLKTTAEHLTQDIIERPTSTLIRNAYTSWDSSQMDVEVIQGEFRGLPVCCVIKAENRGKRDGIILIRSFLYNFNQRGGKNSSGSISQVFFTNLSDFLVRNSLPSVEYIVGMDADTRFDKDCVINLMNTAREGEHVIGVSGCVLADFTTSKALSIPYIYQNAEYIIGQHRRRLRQDLTSKKVTCLPGCCQLLRVIESTCGDNILQQFGYYPKETDGLFRTIRSMMSEDRDHVCLVLREYPDVEVRQCLAARAFTSVPQSYSVFLSQRRRWTLGPIVSDILLSARKSTGWVERLAAIASVFDWMVTLSMFLSRWFREDFDPLTGMVFYALVTFRDVWNLSLIFVSPSSFQDAIRYVIGAVICNAAGPYVGMSVILYSLYHLDDFRWGKTRVVSDEYGKPK